ncbi:hypothetical protein F441_12359 [Phytophthora nicotianae CJ01A1]|uniref:Uncharacterized protein n=5 Tax=Phytophthora nicotianae TaxID=4792 RepID=V9EWQ7_PHYNI|nr:hypothetical protein F443_12373 [Phytophthora nicotianae P1569]ETK82514.1 hypothetical protein L915_12095 [Phytophthora nicotianae]ETO71106.1 hypothetical protein F444_12473 [Phytophthora nicotianae P1976]ETP12200.1 hypothetical protein F441_12359 [Phytophthora nicotianae CJ01A1]ETP40337.1 hypothetical protein F442_12294 [Phytophthora nicotianae P10297]KUF83411.1 hypothetical protein AM587_10006665 [Phytophthora nicotianae]
MAPLAEATAPTTPALEQATVLKQKIIEEPQEPQSEAACEEDNEVDEPSTQQETEADEAQEPPKKRVRFDLADVVEFEPTMWTATVSSEGVPLGMSVDVRRRTKRPLDTYENERVSYRVDRQEYMELGYLEPEERLDILENAGHSISIISHVERETLRINRERWESNEYDLMYQYGLGEVPLMEDGDMEMMQHDDIDDIMHVDDSSEDDFFFGGGGRNMVVDSEVRFAMEDLDAYDAINTRTYDDLSIDYAADCILGDNESSDENNELPYAVDSFDSPLSCDLLEMGTSPSDVSDSSNCMLVAATAASCAQSATATSASASSPTDVVSSVETAPVVAV